MWAPEEIVASSGRNTVSCSLVTISIVRATETTLWVNEPMNMEQALCKDSPTKVIKWTIEDPPRWEASERD